jgi:enoyl-CoA hydratase/carnithine racemase
MELTEVGELDGVLFSVSDHIARITLNRPERGNALTAPMMQWFRSVWRRVGEDPDIRCVLITGTGDRHFCTGADLNAVAEAGSVGAGLGRVTQEVFFTSRQNNVWKPTVCAVNGMAAGGGLHFVVDADIVVASTNALFVDSHVNVGMVGGIENVGLAKRLPLGTALRMTLQGRNYRLSAERAYALGLVEELVAPEALLPTAERIAHDITLNSPHAVSLSQQAVWSSVELPYTQAVEYSYGLVKTNWQHPDFIEGPRAFAEKRPPQWTT